MPAHRYDYCDKNPNSKDPKDREERIAKRRARPDKRAGGKNTGGSELSKLKATVAAQKKLLAIKHAKSKAVEMEAASKIIFDDDKDLDIQAAALQSYLSNLEAQPCKCYGCR